MLEITTGQVHEDANDTTALHGHIKGLPTIRLSRELPEAKQLKALTITKRGRRLWVNLTYAVEQAQPNASGLAVGIDMGVANRIALSTGEAITRRNKPNNKLIRAQQRLSRCRKGSRRWRERRAVLSNAQDRESGTGTNVIGSRQT